MVQEILNGNEYDIKADICSISIVFYEFLFGKPLFTASNIIDLLKNIKNKRLKFPRKINNINEVKYKIILE